MMRFAPIFACCALALGGCTVFEEIAAGIDAQLVGPVLLQPRAFSETDPDTGDTVFRTRVERIVIVEGRSGSTAPYEAGRLAPLDFGIAETSQSEVGAALGSPDDRLVLGSALEFLSDTVEYHIAVWRLEEPLPLWQATDNMIFSDLEAACDLEAIFAPQIQQRIETEDGPVTLPLDIEFIDQRGGDVGEYPVFYTGWLSENSLALQIETAFRIEITDAAGRLLDIP
ncbi:MAG: hypothetical protein KJN93_10460, partial [Alphaproteobacteria bacterium]|nr:hypothetical protein [Alphaproteobacteria bacterium]